MKKFISLVLCFAMIWGVFSQSAFAAEEEQSLEDIIRPQVEAYAKSVDQTNADGKAADKLAAHGIRGNGKKLSVGESHPLTATLVNSELMKTFLAESCIKFIETERNVKNTKLYGLGECQWVLKESNVHFLYIYDYSAKRTGARCPKDYLEKFNTVTDASLLPSSYNDYDDSLEWMAGEIYVDLEIEEEQICDDKIIYKINVFLHDTFDFSTENEGTLKNLLGLVGMLLFEPFEWESKFSFQIEIPVDEHTEDNLPYVLGDVNNDGNINVIDANLVRKASAKLVELDEKQTSAADVNGDGTVNVIDANLIRKFAAKLIDSFVN